MLEVVTYSVIYLSMANSKSRLDVVIQSSDLAIAGSVSVSLTPSWHHSIMYAPPVGSSRFVSDAQVWSSPEMFAISKKLQISPWHTEPGTSKGGGIYCGANWGSAKQGGAVPPSPPPVQLPVVKIDTNSKNASGGRLITCWNLLCV